MTNTMIWGEGKISWICVVFVIIEDGPCVIKDLGLMKGEAQRLAHLCLTDLRRTSWKSTRLPAAAPAWTLHCGAGLRRGVRYAGTNRSKRVLRSHVEIAHRIIAARIIYKR
jgi:hypothetical protein